jgi:hypothetical protein
MFAASRSSPRCFVVMAKYQARRLHQGVVLGQRALVDGEHLPEERVRAVGVALDRSNDRQSRACSLEVGMVGGERALAESDDGEERSSSVEVSLRVAGRSERRLRPQQLGVGGGQHRLAEGDDGLHRARGRRDASDRVRGRGRAPEQRGDFVEDWRRDREDLIDRALDPHSRFIRGAASARVVRGVDGGARATWTESSAPARTARER